MPPNDAQLPWKKVCYRNGFYKALKTSKQIQPIKEATKQIIFPKAKYYRTRLHGFKSDYSLIFFFKKGKSWFIRI